jgi:hypothetical protein
VLFAYYIQTLAQVVSLTGTVVVGNRSRALALVDRQTGVVSVTSDILPFNPQCEYQSKFKPNYA